VDGPLPFFRFGWFRDIAAVVDRSGKGNNKGILRPISSGFFIEKTLDKVFMEKY